MKWNKIQPLLQMPLYKSPSNAVMMKWKNKLICEDGALKGCKTKKKKIIRLVSFTLYLVFALLLTHLLEKVEKKEQHEGCAAAWKCENCLLCSAGCCLILKDNGSALSSFFAPLCLFKHLELLLSSSSSLLCKSPTNALSHICSFCCFYPSLSFPLMSASFSSASVCLCTQQQPPLLSPCLSVCLLNSYLCGVSAQSCPVLSFQ